MESTTTASTTSFKIIPELLKEMDEEASKTRKILALVPDGKPDYAPHPKSMKMGALAVHLAEIAAWPQMILNTPGLDFSAMDFTPTQFSDNAGLLQIFDDSYATGRASLASAQEADLAGTWNMHSGDHVHMAFSKYSAIRHSFQQTTHHRAQLGVYLRLLDIPIPGTYGPSADDTNF